MTSSPTLGHAQVSEAVEWKPAMNGTKCSIMNAF